MDQAKLEPVKFFNNESLFNNLSLRAEIVSDMPNICSFKKGVEKIARMKMQKINPEMLPCYKSPLLSKEQEFHLFRKMNYLKGKVHTLANKIENCQHAKAKMRIANYVQKKITETRNIIAESNFRLATQIMKHKKNDSNNDAVLSDAYLDVLKAVDYFNWNLGLRFSTYATWVVKKNFFRESKSKVNYAEKMMQLDETRANCLEDLRCKDSGEKDQKAREDFIQKLIVMLLNEDANHDRVRQAYVLENYFGVCGKQKMTLEQISAQIGVTKERVRQLKEKGLEWIRQKMREYDYCIDDANYF